MEKDLFLLRVKVKNKTRGQRIKKFYYYILAIIVLCCTGILIYSNTFHAPFYFDDFSRIVTNLDIRNLSNIKAIWYYWPQRFISILSFSVNYHFHQLNVFGYHLVNLSIHIISAILVFFFIFLTFFTPKMKEVNITRHANIIAFFAALIFLSHPIQTQAVTYIVQRCASLATLFYLASLIFYIKSRLLKERLINGNIYYFLSLIMAVTAMFTKEIAITLPLIVLLYEIHFFKTKNRIKLIRLIPFFITLLIIPITMFKYKLVNVLEMRAVIEAITPISPLHYLFTQFRVMVTYIRLLFLPINQNFDYDYAISKALMHLPTLASLLLLIIIFIIAIRIFNKYRLISFSIFYFFLTLLPESSVIPIKDVIFEHRLYLPMVGYSLFLTSLVYYRFAVKTIKPMVIILVTLIVCYSMFTYSRNYIWKDEFRLWNDTIRKSPKKARPYVCRGDAYFNIGYIDKAIADYTKAIKLNPNLVIGYCNRGNAYSNKDYFDQAIADYTKAIELNPKAAKAYHNRAVTYFYKKEYDKSWDDVRKTQMLGYVFQPGFLEELERACGVQK